MDIKIRGYIDRRKLVVNFGQFVYPVAGESMRYRGWMGSIAIFACYKHYFIRLYGNMLQHPSNNISNGIPHIKIVVQSLSHIALV